MTKRLPLLLAAAVLPLAACHHKTQGNSLDALDNQLVNGSAAADPLRGAITVDPARTKGGAKVAAAAATRPGDGKAAVAGMGNCISRYGAQLNFADTWVRRLPAELPLPEGAHLTEAAGHDGGCAIRAASFTLPGSRDAALGWYKARAQAAGYDAGRADRGGDLILAGDKGKAAFSVIVGTPAGGATPVDFVWVQDG